MDPCNKVAPSQNMVAVLVCGAVRSALSAMLVKWLLGCSLVQSVLHFVPDENTIFN